MSRHETASQTAGPYVHIGCLPNQSGISGVYPYDLGTRPIADDTQGTRITVHGTIFDGTGAPVKDAMIETWQADAAGRYATTAAGFTGWGRHAADADTGLWQIQTIKPGAIVQDTGPDMAPHITLWIVARGLNIGLHTRMYFPQDTAAHAIDPVLAHIQDPTHRQTLVATDVKPGQYRFDIHLQGPQETVFFDV
ncbi:protocatechuate 3,4-dioxygenase subunit alpha [Roseobacter sp.]|uniref:protocatechuate 3,4-dioxygenase subunit alpha n=1 Tax=Roseobacter sp. TaxID=1907202 RepID=UPI003297D7A3